MTAIITGPKTPNPKDKIIGGNVRRLRNGKGLTQEKLAAALGLTFQQVQKYEKGTNRIGGSRLTQICDALGCNVQELFTGIPINSNVLADAAPDPCLQMGTTRIGARAAAAFIRLPGELQAGFATMMEAIADHRGKP
jgi:transcriptional regulator with XRE-family HTH domain